MTGELERWRNLATLAHEMATRAVAHDWDQLVVLNTRFQQLMAAPSHLESPLPETARKEKASLIQGILADFDTVRTQVGPWMTDVRPLLDAWQHTASPTS